MEKINHDLETDACEVAVTAFDGATFRHVMGHYPTGVCAITAIHDGVPVSMIVGSFSSVSLEPPLVAFFPDRKSASWARIAVERRFCVNVLSAQQQDVCHALASKREDKFAAVPHRLSATGLPIIENVIAWIDCDFYAIHEAGDHFIAIGKVRAFEVETPQPPLLFFKGGYGQFGPLEER